MKRILLTGESSYVGNSFESWLNQSGQFIIDKISVRDDEWKEIDFSSYDTLVHLAGIVHSGEEISEEKYYKVNTKLTYELASKAKVDGIGHFIFLSTMSVFGKSEGAITDEDKPNPSTKYGVSKYEAENQILELDDFKFSVSIVRPPMIYGKGSPGNYQRLSRLAQKTKVFPKINNRRSMIYIDHLCEYLKILLNNELNGIFHPQNQWYVNTTEMLNEIANVNNNKVFLIPIPKLIINNLRRINVFKKVFGDLYYQIDDPIEPPRYNVYEFKKTLWRTEGSCENRSNLSH